jgi:hypothetical protein
MTILDTAIAVLVGITARDVFQQVYFELRYRLRRRKPNQYQFLLDNLEEEEN